MTIHRIIKSIILITVISIGTFTTVVAQGFSNPISPYSPEDFADPSVVYNNGYYYGVNSENGSSKIAVYKSQTLKNLYYSSSKTIVWVAPSTGDHSEAIWAPFLQYIQGNWYIYYTATSGGVTKNHRMFALKANTQDPQGSYQDAGSIYATNTDFYAIDGKVIVKPTDGSLYFVWSGAQTLPSQNIYIAAMSDPTHISGSAVMISGSTASWENQVHESPDFIYKNGKSILSYSTGELLTPGAAGYKTGTLTNTNGNYLSASSWVKSSSSVFQYYSGSDGVVYAPGATRFIKSPDGTEDWLVYHAKHFNDYNYNREIRAQKFTWDKNNNPLFDHPIPSGVIMPNPSGEDPLPAEIISGGNYKIIARNSSLAATVLSSSLLAGAKIEQRSFTGTESQKWVITNLSNGFYKIISKNSSLALAITNSSIDNGATLEQQTYTGQDNQQWKISTLGNGYYVISSKFSQKCMDVTGNVVTEGTLIDQWPFLGFNNQQWSLVNLLETPVVTPIIGTYTYSGAPQGPNAATNTGTGSSYTFSYANSGGTTYGPSGTAPTNIGRYTVTATVAANGNYGSATSSVRRFSIEAATPNTVVYSENFENASVGATTLGNADAMNYGGGAAWTFGLDTNNPVTGLKSGYFNITNTGSDWWTLQYRIDSRFAVKAGVQYKVSFNIQSSVANTIAFYAQVTTNFSQTLTLTGGNAIEKFSITTPLMDSSGNNPNFFLAFGKPGVPAQIWIDDIVIEEIKPLSTPIVTPTIGSYTYTGTSQGPNTATNTGTGSSYTYSYVNSGGTTYGPSATAPTNAGNYTVTVTVAADGNYGAASSSATAFTIGAATPIITVTPIGTYTYSGAAQGPSAITGNSGSGTVSWSYAGTGSSSYTASSTRPTNAGTYTATATVAANGNYGAASSNATAFTIGTMIPTVTVTPIGTYTYSGAPQGPNSATNTGTGSNYTYSYVNSGGTTYGPSATAPTNIGRYTVTATVAANGNYGSATSSVRTFSIEAATLNTVVYSENFENATVGATTLGNADAMNYGGGAAWTFGLDTNNPVTGLKSGYFNVTNTGSDWWTLQYRIDSRFAVKAGVQYKVSFNIQSSVANTIAFYAQGTTNFSQTLTLTGGNAIEKFSITTPLMDSSGNNANFLLAFGKPGVPAQIWIDDIVIEEIKPLSTPIVTPTIGTYTYSGAAQGPNTATNTGTGSSYTYSYVNSGGTTYGPSATAPTNAGNYTVTVTVAADGNYGAASSSATAFTIGAATPIITVSPIGTYTYSGAAQGPTTITGNSGSGTVSWSYAGTGTSSYTASSTRPTNAGTYTATATVAANGNYGAASSSATAFTIEIALPNAPTIGVATVTGLSGQAKVAFTAPAFNGGSAITSYIATSSPGGLTGTLSQAGSGIITVNGLTNGTSYTFTVKATNISGQSTASGASNEVTPMVTPTPQTITFGALSAVNYGDAVVPGATASSKLAVTYSSSNSAVATASGSTVTIVGVGTTTITASQAGDATYAVATAVAQSLVVNPKALSITTANIASKIYNSSASSGAVTPGNLSGFVGTETVTATATGVYANATVGTGKSATISYTLANGANGGLAANYSLANGTASGEITVAPLTVSGVTANNKVADGTTTATLSATGSLSGVYASDSANVTLVSSGYTANFADASVGTDKAVTISGYSISGSAAANYSLAQPTEVTANISAPTAFYFVPTTGTDFNATANWWSNSTGSGVHPSTLTAASTTYYVYANASTTAALTLGSGSKIVLGNASSAGVTLTINTGFAITGTIDATIANSGSNSIVLLDATPPSFGILHSSSEVHLQATTVLTANPTNGFGKLYIDGVSNTVNNNIVGNTIIQTLLQVNAGSKLATSGGSGDYFTINNGGSVIINGTLLVSKEKGLTVYASGVTTTGSNGGDLQFLGSENLTFGPSSIVEYNKATNANPFTITGRSYVNLTISGLDNNKAIGTGTSVSGILTLNVTGTSTVTGFANVTLANGASIVRTSGSFDGAPTFGSSVNVSYNGTTAQTSGNEIPTSGSVLNNLTVNNAAGVSLGTSIKVNGALTFTAGKITTSTNTLTMGTSGTIVGAASATGWVVGNLKKLTTSGASPSFTYPLGDATNYTPLALTFSGTTSATGGLTAKTTSGDHASFASSGLNSAKSVNRTWTLTNDALSSYGTYSARFAYATADNDANTTSANYAVRIYDGSTWSTAVTSGTTTETAASASAITGFGDFAIGECTPTTSGSVSTSICTGGTYTWPANGVSYTTAQSGITYVSGCNTATLNLTVTPAPLSAGLDGSLVICAGSTVDATSLYAALAGTPAEGGTWSATTGGAGSYTYTQAATSPCTTANSATVTVTEQAAPSSAGSNGSLVICAGTSVNTTSLYAALGGTPAEGGTWSATTGGAGSYTYTQAATSPCTTANTAIVTVTEQAAPASAGLDGSLVICAGSTVDVSSLYAALAGTPAAGGTWSATTGGAGSYTYTQAATSPCTTANTAIVTVTEQAAPLSAGLDGSLVICAGSTVDVASLYAALGGTPAEGGTWSATTGGAGSYTYTQAATSPCTTANTAIVMVTEQAAPLSAGTNASLVICAGTSVDASSLYAALGGTPAEGGTWSATTGGTGSYTYTQAATSPCTSTNTAIVMVTEQVAPNAGTDGVLTVCAGTTPTNSELFAALSGADSNGTWSDPVAGVYTYTVAATQPCTATDTAKVTVNTFPTLEFTTQPVPTNICISSGTATISAVASGVGSAGLAYQWQVKTKLIEADWTPISDDAVYKNSNTASLEITNPEGSLELNQNLYKLIVTDLSSSPCISAITSNEIALTVNNLSLSGTISGRYGEICSGSSKTLTNVGAKRGVIQWLESVDGLSYSPIVDSPILSVYTAPYEVSKYIKVVRTSGACPSVSSEPFLVKINNTSVAGTISGGDVSVCSGENVVLTLNNSIGNIQWQRALVVKGVVGSYSDCLYATKNTLSLSLPTATTTVWSYRASVSVGECSTIEYTAPVTVTVLKSVSGTISGAGTICSGSSKQLKLSSNIGVIQWQSSTDGQSWATIDQATGNTYSASPTVTTSYRVQVTNGVCTPVSSQAVVINVVAAISAGTITEDNFTVCYNTVSTLHLQDNSNATITWYKSTNGTTWTKIVNTTGAELSTGNLSVSTWYKVAVSNGTCNVETPIIKVTVNPLSRAGTITRSASTVCAGANTTTLTLAGATGAIQWQSASTATGVYSNISTDANSAIYTASNLTATTYYKAMLKSGVCDAATAAAVGIIVSPAAKATVISGAGAVCFGSTKVLTLASGSVGTIQWQSSTDNSNFTPISGATAASYTVPATTIAGTYYYRAVLTSGVCTTKDVSNILTVDVNAKSAAGSISGATTVCPGTNTTTLTLAESTGAIQWQSSSTAAGVYSIISTNSANYTATNLTATKYYKAVVTNGVCPFATATAVGIIVSPAARATAITANVTSPSGATSALAICNSFSTAKVLTIGSGYTGVITWQYSKDNISWASIDKAVSNSYTVNVASAGANYYRAKFSTAPCSPDAYSLPFRLYYKSCSARTSLEPTQETNANTSTLSVKAYPNPSSTVFNLEVLSSIKGKATGIQVYDMIGRLIEQRQLESNSVEIGSNYPSGVYNIMVNQGENTKTLRVIKR